MLPNLHKRKQINGIMQKHQCEYIKIEENITAEAHPIVVFPVYHTSSRWEKLHILMESSLAMISHITKDFFDFKNRLDKRCPNGTTLNTCDIKSLYTNLWDDLFYTAVEYCIKKLQNYLTPLRHF